MVGQVAVDFDPPFHPDASASVSLASPLFPKFVHELNQIQMRGHLSLRP
jgi:hypothetical protein